MKAAAPEELTEEENSKKAVTVLRYLIRRDKASSTSTLGFRIEKIRVNKIYPRQRYCNKSIDIH